MIEHQLPVATSYAPGAPPAVVPAPASAGARVGLHVSRRTTPPGQVEMVAQADHHLKIHIGQPVEGGCQHHRFLYTRGDVDIYPAGASDVWHEEQSSTSLIVRVAPSLLRRAAEEMGLDPTDPAWSLATSSAIQIEHIALALDAERAAGQPGGLLYAESLGLALAVHLLGRYPAPLPASRTLSDRQLRRLMGYIEEHLDHDLSLDYLASVVHVSPSHLKTLFKRSTGLAVHEYVMQRRVERARALLVRGDRPIAQVALEAGFAHQSHLARWMRRVLGVTPSAVLRGA